MSDSIAPQGETPNSAEAEDHNLSSDLKQILTAHENDAISVRDIVATLGDRGFGLLIVLLSLPSALPVPAAGYSIPFGILLAILAAQIIAGRSTPWLPNWALNMKLGRKMSEGIVNYAVKFFDRMEHLIKRRFEWAAGRAGLIFAGSVIIFMSGVMIIPIPMTNTFPAFVIFLVGVGMTEKDGLIFIGAAILGALTACFYGFIIYVAIFYGVDAVIGIKDWIKALIGLG